jgi:predicted O-linked N-acetylglucosamine transferase (SPINDLY family)
VARPIVTWQGDKWYNRIGSQLVRMAGVPELAATSEQRYVEIALRLIADDAWRMELQRRLRATNFENSLFGTGDAQYFPRAIEFLVANHDRLQCDTNRTAIRIEREAVPDSPA